jgi:hypothetical protein
MPSVAKLVYSKMGEDAEMPNEKRLIDAKPLMQNGWHLVKTGKSNVFIASMSLADVPTVDAVEVVHGKWIEEREIPSYSNKNIPVVECSKCRCFFCDIINVHSFMYHYCPNCGAKMDGGNEDG